jgi:hypothetical protein
MTVNGIELQRTNQQHIHEENVKDYKYLLPKTILEIVFKFMVLLWSLNFLVLMMSLPNSYTRTITFSNQ